MVTRALHIYKLNIGKDKRYGEIEHDTRKSFLTSDCDSEKMVLMICIGWCLSLYQGTSWCFGVICMKLELEDDN